LTVNVNFLTTQS